MTEKLSPIPFNKAYIAGRELYYIAQAVSRGELKGDGPFTHRCGQWIESKFGIPKALITHSCTGALEMAAILLEISPGDEVILPSFTFTSTANAFLLRGARPVFADIDPLTLNITAAEIARRLTPRTKAICVVHYAGVACDMDPILELARQRAIPVVEDAAHAIMSKYRGRWLGGLGELSTFSFHETKNFSSGEGGALLINDPRHIERAEIIREKGTNRSRFHRGEVDKYTWCDTGGSFLPSEIVSAFLYGQLEHAESLTEKRLEIWNRYFALLEPLERAGVLRRPHIPAWAEHNAHLFYVILESGAARDRLLEDLRRKSIGAVFHYLPLHSSPMGRKFGSRPEDLPITEDLSCRLLRLPLFMELTAAQQEYIAAAIAEHFGVTEALPPRVANL